MSSLLRPVGHLPASVYWFRRALVLVVAVVVLVLLGRLFGGGGEDPRNSAASGPQPSQTPSTPVDPSGTPSETASGEPTGGASDRPRQSETSGTPEPPKECSGRDVRVSVLPAARTMKSGAGLNFAVRLTGLRAECRATIDPTLLSLTVTSGNDRIWTTAHCEQAVPRATLLVAKGKESATTVAWNGRRSGPGCLPGQPQAKPGTYVVEAAYDGQASAAQAFYVVA